MARKKLFLHIGTHKTGTTTIQNALESARDELASKGICYARTDREPFPHLTKHASVYRAVMESDAAFDAEFEIFERELSESGCDTLLLSEEGLSEAHFTQFSRFSRLLERYDITVICFLRRQDYFLESVWNQYCREGHERQVIENFVKRNAIWKRVEYANILAFWSGLGKVEALSFDMARSQGIVSEFGKRIGVDLQEPDRSANVSPGMNAAAALALLNRFDYSYPRPIVVQAFRTQDTKFALGSRLRAEILERISGQNRLLQEVYGITFDDAMPKEPPEPLRIPRPEALAAALNSLAQQAKS